jgi:hypothetical protein
MQKILRFLESSVEWIALAIAVIFLGWTAFYYLISDPVSQPLEGHPVNPGTVDSFIDQNAAQRLREKMGDVQVPSFAVEPFDQAVDREIGLVEEHPSQLASADFDYSPFDAIGTLAGARNNLGVPVTVLPTLPMAQPLLVAAALDTIAPPAAPGAPVAATGKDMRLVVVAFTIPWADLFVQWNKAFGPPQPGGQPRLAPADFQILAVTAYRSEKIGDIWTKDEEVPAFGGGPQGPLPAYPAAGNRNAEVAYLLALAKQPTAVFAPTIPTPIAGVVWKDPLSYLPGTSNQPGNPGAPDQNGASLPPNSEQRIVVNTSEPLAGTLFAQNRGGGPPVNFGPGGGRFGGMPLPPRPAQPPATPAPAPPTPVAPAPGTVDPVVTLANPTVTPNPMPIEPVTKLNIIATPAKSPDLCVYVVDSSTNAGKSYRYRIVYKVLNPLFNKAPEHAVNKNWVNQFDLVSPVSGFSPQIDVPVQTYFFCGKPQGINKSAAFPFDVFTWSNGKWQKDTFNVNLGDPIGGADGGVDYSTGYSFVDKRTVMARNKTIITIVDRDGIPDIRDAAKDADSPDYKEKAQWVEQDKNGGPQPGAQPGFIPNQGPGGGPPYGSIPPGMYGGPSRYGTPQPGSRR